MRGKPVAVLFFFSAVCLFSEIAETPLHTVVFDGGGRGETVLQMEERGNFSLQISSPTGAALTLIDRMAGVLATDGRVGRTDGRLDVLLDRGEYKAVIQAADDLDGVSTLKLFRYSELNIGNTLADLPGMEEGKMISTTLGDLEQRSYWLYVPEESDRIHLEIIGRNLTGCRFWKNGQWILDIQPKLREQFDTETGRPMTYMEFSDDLPAGHYLITCVGGRGLTWAEETGEHPLHLRLGVPYLGSSGRQRLTVSPFGRDSFWVDGESSYFELLREEPEPTRLSISGYEIGRSRFSSSRYSEITDKSSDPTCEINMSLGGEKQWLTVQSAPGDAVELRYFVEATRGYELPHDPNEKKSYWVSSISSSEAENTIDLTPILFDPLEFSIKNEQSLAVGPHKPLIRKINLLGENTAFLKIEQGGTYRIQEDEQSGARGKYRFVLFEEALAGTAENPPFQSSGEPFELTSAIYIFDLLPEHAGILHFVLYREEEGREKESAEDARKGLRASADASVFIGSLDPEFAWQEVTVDPGMEESLFLFFNLRHEVVTGLTIREIPLDLREPFSVILEPGEEISIPVSAAERATVAVDEPHAGLQITISPAGMQWKNSRLEPGSILDRGEYTLTVRNTGGEKEFYRLYLEALRETAPRPEVLPIDSIFPLITEGEPFYSDYGRGETKQLLLRVKEPSLYRIETTGRLAMGINVRTALATSLFSVGSNGIGRNSLVQAYLKPGDYLVEASALGQSQGRAGLALNRTALRHSDTLLPGLISRETVEPDQALRYILNVPESGSYHIETFGLGRSFRFRLEDRDGWPLFGPEKQGGTSADLQAGLYTYTSLPESLKTRRLTLLNRVDREADQNGHLELNSTIDGLWRETANRKPDVYTIDLPAPILAAFLLSDGMLAEHTGPDGEKETLTGGEEFERELPAGRHTYRLRSAEEDDRKPYSLSLSTDDLIPGMTRRLTSLPAYVPVSLGKESITDIWSFGGSDIKTTLLYEDRSIAENDDRRDDWNFLISRRLPAGRYLLKIEKVGYWSGSCEVSMGVRGQINLPEETVPHRSVHTFAREVMILPIRTGSDTDLVHLRSDPNSSVSLALYREERMIAEAENELYIPLKPDSRYTLRFWHQGDVSRPVGLEVSAMNRKALLENVLPVNENLLVFPPNFQGIVDNGAGMSVTISSGDTDLLFSPGIERPCMPLDPYPVNTESATGWIVGTSTESYSKVKISPLELSTGRTSALYLSDLRHSFQINHTRDEALILEAESQGLTTGLMVVPRSEYNDTFYLWDGIELAPSRTLIGIPGQGDYRGKLWRAEPRTADIPAAADTRESTSGEDGIQDTLNRIDLTLRAFPIAEEIVFHPSESRTIEIDAGMAVRVRLEEEVQEMNLLLARNFAAFSWHEGLPRAFASARGTNLQTRMILSGGVLILANMGGETGLAKLQSLGGPLRVKEQLILPEGYEGVMEEPGTVIFRVDPGTLSPEGLLCVAGENVDPLFRTSDGQQLSGRLHERGYLIFPAASGELLLRHGGGFLKIWGSRDTDVDTSFLGSSFVEGFPDRRSPESVTSLEGGTGRLEQRSQWWSFSMDNPGFISLESRVPGICAVIQDPGFRSGEPAVQEATSVVYGGEGRSVFQYLPRGRYLVFTRPLEGIRQDGRITLEKIYPVDLSEDAEDRKRFIGPEEQQAFRFHVRSPGKIGIGLEVEADRLEARVYDSGFRLIGSGPILFAELPEGEYFLIVRSGGTPVQYRPVLYGLDGSLQEIPPDVIRQYEKEAQR